MARQRQSRTDQGLVPGQRTPVAGLRLGRPFPGAKRGTPGSGQPADTASACGGRYFDLTINTSDVEAIASALSDAYKVIDDEALPWLDSGYPLVFPMLLLALLWFRPGWTRLWLWLLLPCLLSVSEAPRPSRVGKRRLRRLKPKPQRATQAGWNPWSTALPASGSPRTNTEDC